MAALSCPQCGFVLDPLNPACPRCAQGIVPAVGVSCPACGQSNSNKTFACAFCAALLPVALSDIERQPLKEYQKRATEHGKKGEAIKAIALLEEAAAFYPEDGPTRQVLMGLYERIGKPQEKQRHVDEMRRIHMRGSEAYCLQLAEVAIQQGDYRQAATIFHEGAQFHPASLSLRDGLVAALHAAGYYAQADAERVVADRLRAQLIQQAQMQASKADVKANSLESAGTALGAATAVGGAVVGGSIAFLSVIGGIVLAVLATIGFTVGSFFCTTFIGALIGLPLMLISLLGYVAAAALLLAGGAVGTGVGGLGIITGVSASLVAMIHRRRREDKR